jgi:hypothetical protein
VKAAAVTDDAIEVLREPDGDVPAFELWRERIRREFE